MYMTLGFNRVGEAISVKIPFKLDVISGFR